MISCVTDSLSYSWNFQETDDSKLKYLEVYLDTNEKTDASIFSEVNDFIHDARQDVDATVLLLDK